MKLISLNIWQGRLLRSAIPFLQEQDPDILCLQEVYSAENPPPGHWESFGTLEAIRDKMDFKVDHFSALNNHRFRELKVTFGNAIFSKFETTDYDETFTKGRFVEEQTADTEVDNSRTIQKCVVKTPQRDLAVVNHHAHREITPKGSEESVLRMKKAREFIGEVDGPLIIAMDSNVNPDTPTAKILQKYGTNLTKKFGINSTMTQFAFVQEGIAPDHIIVSDDITVNSYEASEELVSDHKAMILEFDLS